MENTLKSAKVLLRLLRYVVYDDGIFEDAKMAVFEVTAGITRAGWIPAVGDALRDVGNAIGALMLAPQADTATRSAGIMFRVRVCARVCSLEKRVHATPTRRCSRGRWVRLDSGPTPGSAREWNKLAKFWAWYAAEVSSGRNPYCWTDDLGKNQNQCHTRAHADRLEPSPAGGPGRGRKVKRQPSRLESFGFAPACGHRIAQTAADARVERRNRIRLQRRERRLMAAQRKG